MKSRLWVLLTVVALVIATTVVMTNAVTTPDYTADLTLSADNKAECPVCGTEETWTVLTADSALTDVQSGEHRHYYVKDSFTNTKVNTANHFLDLAGGTVCLHLGGSGDVMTIGSNININWTTDTSNVATLNVFGSGTLAGTGSVYSSDSYGVCVSNVSSYGVVNIYSGTLRSDMTSRAALSYTQSYNSKSGKITIFDNAVIQGAANSTAIRHCGGKIILDGGTVNGRVIMTTATLTGTTSYMKPNFTMEDGVINGIGTEAAPTSVSGAAVYLNYASFTMNGGTINGGYTTANGSAIATCLGANQKQIYIHGGTINGGYAGGVYSSKNYGGGAIYVDGNTATALSTLEIDGDTVITGGKTAKSGGNIYATNTTVTIGGTAKITYGEAVSSGGNIYMSGGSLALGSGVTVSDGKTTVTTSSSSYVGGGNINAVGNSTVTCAAKVENGKASCYGGNFLVSGASLELVSGAYVSGGKAGVSGTASGGNICKWDGGNLTIGAGATVTGGTAGNGVASCVYASNSKKTAAVSNLTVAGSVLGGDLRIYDVYVNTTVTGAAKIDKLQLNAAGIRINVENMTSGADVKVTKTTEGAFTAAIADGKAAEYAQYFHAYDSKQAVDAVGDELLLGAGMKYCEHCDQEVWWRTFGSVTTFANMEDGGHFLVTDDMTLKSQINIDSDDAKDPNIEVVVDLNGHTVVAEERFAMSYAKLYILDSDTQGRGTIKGKYTSYVYGGLILGATNSNTYIYGGTLTLDEGCYGGDGGIFYVTYGTLNIYEGATITGGTAKADGSVDSSGDFRFGRGGNIYLASGGKLNMYGGTISNGTAVPFEKTTGEGETTVTEYNMGFGGNIATADSSACNVKIYEGAVISGGEAAFGGNIYAGKNVITTVNGKVENGTATAVDTYGGLGGNIYSKYKLEVYKGANIFGGVATSETGATQVHMNGCEANVSGGTIGEATDAGLAVVAEGTGKLTVHDGAVYGLVNLAETVTTTIEHGVFTVNPAGLLADGSAVYEDANLFKVHTPAEAQCLVAQTCTTCSEQVAEAKDHNWGEEVAKKDATCSETGFAAHYQCSVCEAYAVKEGDAFVVKTEQELTIAIDETAHNYKEPEYTDNEDGKTHTKIEICANDPKHVKQTSADHTYEDGKCVCGAEEAVYVVAIGTKGYVSLEAAVAEAKENDVIVLLDNVTVTAPVLVPTGVAVDLNGKVLTGTVLGTLQMNGGLLVTAEGYKMFGVGADYYATKNAELFMDAAGTIKLVSGEVTLVMDEWWSLPGQHLVVGEGATFTIPTGKVLQINGTKVVVEGTAVVDGAVNLFSVDATIQAAEGLNVTTQLADYDVVYAGGVYSLKHKPVVVVKPENVTVGGETVTEEQKEAVEDIIDQVVQNQATDKVETGLKTNDEANEALKQELQAAGKTEEQAEKAVQNAQTAVIIELKDVVLSEENKATKLTYDVEPVLVYENQQVKIENTGKIKFHLPVPGYIAAGTSVKVYHDKDLLGFYTVQTDGNGHNYVEVEHDEFSPYSVELSDAVASVGTQGYATVQAALEAAAVNGGTVKLLSNVTVTGKVLVVNQGVTLDLNGKTLSLAENAYLLANFHESYIVDSSEGNTGRLAMNAAKLRLLNNNEQLPVQTADGIMFVDVAIEGKWSESSNCFKFWFADSTDAAFINQLKTNFAGSNVKVQVELSWNNGANSMVYEYQASTLSDYLASWQTYSLTLKVNGANDIDELTYTAKLVFADGSEAEVVKAGDVVTQGVLQ